MQKSLHSSTGRWQPCLSLSNFNAQEFIIKTSHIPSSISTTTIMDEKLFFSNLVSAHLDQHIVRRPQILPFRYMYTAALPSLSHPVTSLTQMVQWIPKVSRILSHPAPCCLGLSSWPLQQPPSVGWPGQGTAATASRSLLKYLLGAQHVPGT